MLVSRPVKVEPALHQHLPVRVLREALAGGDEPGAHIGEIAAQRLGGSDGMAVGHSARYHHDALPELADRAHEGERIGPTGLAARAGRQQHEAVGSGSHGLLRVPHRGDVGQHQAARVLQRLHHRLR
jgi:hypothetical protein